MERYLAAFLTAALLLANAGHSQAGHVYVHQANGPATSGEQFLNLLGIAGTPFEHDFIVDALNHGGQVLIVSSLAGATSGNARFFEPAGVSGPSATDVAFFADARFTKLIGAERTLANEIYGGDTILQRGDALNGDDRFLANFSSGIAPAEPARIAIDLAETTPVAGLALQHKLFLGLSMIGIVALAALAYVLRRRRTVPNRGLRGPRGTAIYRSPTPTNPRGTVR